MWAVLLALLAAHPTEREHPTYTSTNGVAFRSFVLDVKPGQRVCVPSLRVTSDSRVATAADAVHGAASTSATRCSPPTR